MTALLRLPSARGPDDDAFTLASMRAARRKRNLCIFTGFWLLGLLNNSAYVIMVAGANEIAASAVGLVYLCAIGPTILVKLTAPYWFHLVGYTPRFWAAALLMCSSFITVGFSSSTGQQLLGVMLVAIQGGLGEASGLAMCSLYPSKLSVTAWSSGTGFAGVAGYAWMAILHYWLGLSYTATLTLANAMPVAWLAVYHLGLQRLLPADAEKVAYHPVSPGDDPGVMSTDGHVSGADGCCSASSSSQSSPAGSPVVELSSRASAEELPEQQADAQQQQQQRVLVQQSGYALGRMGHCNGAPGSRRMAQQQQHCVPIGSMTSMQRFQATCRLWPYMVPLFLVYFAEYAMQSGTWTAIGFPVTSAAARHKFYLYANWTYQAGVCISRSSGMFYQANRFVLWLMPSMQCVLLVFFSFNAVVHMWYGWSLLLLCLLAGLLGGAVYVNSFTLLSKEVDPALKEFSLGAACVADSLGIACADAAAVLIQGCLFRWQNLSGAAYSCGGGI